MICEDASFINNKYDVVLRKYNSQLQYDATNTRFYRCMFTTSGFLNYGPEEPPAVHLFAERVSRLRIGGCQFWNYTTPIVPYFTEARGDGIYAYNTSVQILPMCNGQWNPACDFALAGGTSPSVFGKLFKAVRLSSIAPNKTAEIRGGSLGDNAASIFVNGVHLPRVNRNLVGVAPGDLTGYGFPKNYGIAVFNSTGFQVEENRFDCGPNDYSLPSVGMVFSNTGDANNQFYNNEFTGNLKYGTIIQHDNDGPSFNDGLHFKCNDYGTYTPNLHDIVFTSNDVSVAGQQGAMGPNTEAPAGNTFSAVTGTTEQHMLADGNALGLTYWHHDPASTPKIVLPTSLTPPPTLNPTMTWTGWAYDKPISCPGNFPLFSSAGAKQKMVAAQAELSNLRAVYDAERDGGDTEGLKDFIYNNASNSYEIRNRLMLAAPKVSREIWEQVFALDPPMNPWHLAQALIQNSPLQPEVLLMMEDNGLSPFYKQLVLGAQGDGISMLSIQESEMAHFAGEYARALNELTADALESETAGAIDDVLAWEAAHPQAGLPMDRIALLMAKNDLASAKTITDSYRALAEPDAGMEVLGMYLDLKVAGLDMENADAGALQRLEQIANTSGAGQGQAQAWLETIGYATFPEEVILPHDRRAVTSESGVEEPAAQELVRAYPNPANGKEPVYMVLRLPEGMDGADVRVYDPEGRLVHQTRVAQRTGIVELPAAELANGLYAVQVTEDGVGLGASKFVVVR